jgi:Rhodopirellula transposase DDE domain
MKDRETKIKNLRDKWERMYPFMDERSRRIWAGLEAKELGIGGKTIVHEATGLDWRTIAKGMEQAINKKPVEERLRSAGGGRKRVTENQDGLKERLEALVAPHTKGDPMTPLRWTSKSTTKLSEQLNAEGFQISPKTVGTTLKEMDYSLQLNRKEKEGGEHNDRDAQFEYINTQIKLFQKQGKATLSVDTKKKENIGDFKNGGREYHKKGEAPRVRVYDFIDKELGKVAPYGVYDIAMNKGMVNVGISNDTAEFAVNSIRMWYYQMGETAYKKTDGILVTADCGGSNSNRCKLWKVELQKLANEIGKTIHVCHFPPGTSKWNKIEHKMFCFITMNWRGEPLITHQAVVQLIGNTKTKTGLSIKAVLDKNIYEKGIKVSNEELEKINIKAAKFHGEWNYKIAPNN